MKIAIHFAVLFLGALSLSSFLSAQTTQTGTTPAASIQLSSRIFNVRDFSAVGDGKTLDTKAISAAIHVANSAGGGTVLFPPGVYLTGTFELLSNVTLNVQAGAIIEGSKNLADYDSISKYGFAHDYGTNSTGEGALVGIIVARNVENVAIIGRGIIDGNADEFFDESKAHVGMDFDPQFTRQGQEFLKSVDNTTDGPLRMKDTGRPGTMIVFIHSQNVLIRDITFRNAPNWTFHLLFCRRATITGFHIVNSLLLPNNDGIDCFGCRDVHISDCDITAGDDDFAFFAAADVTVSNCSLTSRSASIRLEDSRHCIFSNLTMHSNRGIGIFEREGNTSDLLFTNITFDTHLIFGHWWGKAEPIFISIGPPRDNHKAGQVHDVRFSNIIGEAEGGMVMYGDATSSIRDIYLDHIKLKMRTPKKAVSDLAGGNFDFRWTATSLANAVFQHDIPGIYGRHIEGLHVQDFTLEWEANVPSYFSSAIELEDFANFDLDGFHGRQAPHTGSSPAIALNRGQGISIRNSTAAPGTSTFLGYSEITGEGLFAQNDLSAAAQAFAPTKNSFTLFGNRMPGKGKPE